MRLKIAHTTTYRYEPPATGVIQILRMTPGSHDGQYVANWQIDVSTDSRLDVHEDAFGNITHVLTHGPLSDLTINVEGLVETHDTGGVLRGTDERFPPSLFLRATPLTEVNAAMARFANDLRVEAGGDTLGFLHALLLQINDHMTFDTDPTSSGTRRRKPSRSSVASVRITRISLSPARAAPAFPRVMSPAICCAPTAWSRRMRATPGRKPMSRPSAGSASTPPTRSAPPTPMSGSPSGSTISAQHLFAARAMAAARKSSKSPSGSIRQDDRASRKPESAQIADIGRYCPGCPIPSAA